jgi:hypothetical protein
MAELRTLKDLRSVDALNTCVYRNELREEAIKWFKRYKDTHLEVINLEDVSIENWIKHFFNLTEEDLEC